MNPHPTQDHLTPDQLDEYLIDPASALPAEQQHLAACHPCRAQLAAFQSDLDAFNQATLAWANAKSATLPAIAARLFRGASSWGPLASCSAALACAVLVFTMLHHPAHPPQTAIAQAAITQTAPSQIASDNQLLSRIDEAVYAPVASPNNLFDTPTSHPGAR